LKTIQDPSVRLARISTEQKIMVDYTDSSDEPPPSSTQRRDQRAIYAICRILRVRFGVPTRLVCLDSHFVDDLDIEAAEITDLILALEEAFDIDISIPEAVEIRTVRDAVLCVLAKAPMASH